MAMDIADLPPVEFNEDTEPRDDRLLELLDMAYRGQITCTMAVADMGVIVPFSDFRPTVSDSYRAHFVQQLSEQSPPALYVYAQDGKLIMSDDYSAYSLYLEYGLEHALCVVIGETPPIDGVHYQGEPFVLPLPSVEVLPSGD